MGLLAEYYHVSEGDPDYRPGNYAVKSRNVEGWVARSPGTRTPLLPCQECYLPTVATCTHGHLCPECRDAGCQPCADDTDPLDAAHETRRDDEAIDARREGP